ncbi:hypothetical protein K435DRAFT_880724 [Dendrothele bispora CBS 962.96]|uniref:MULE transposase domain-containing protein n=1 Tax=Dendrothele bispora (strain CBS 962.96) TaxID=1314807 RepID=A0A4S8KJC0_DENBC|nr:hypothetical protein K435DRAFT_880724 [Dendrothele bispora CBS 962.96]
MAEVLVEYPTQVDPALEAYAEKLVEEAWIVVEAEEWKPLFVMIDKYRPEYIAVNAVWDDMCIRLCQFHVIQAILRWDDDHGKLLKARLQLSRVQKYKLLWSFRELQHAHDEESWMEEKNLFLERLRIIVPKESFNPIKEYFEQNWFTKFWRDLWTDIGLPEGHNRDEISTNNFTERAFKMFDEIFLENRANKLIYRLVLILANEWFEYFRAWHPNGAKRPDRDYHQTVVRGHEIWNSGVGVIFKGLDKKGRRVWRVVA